MEKSSLKAREMEALAYVFDSAELHEPPARQPRRRSHRARSTVIAATMLLAVVAFLALVLLPL